MGSKSAAVSFRLVLGLLSMIFIVIASSATSSFVFGQQASLANLRVSSIELSVNGVSTFSLETPGTNVGIEAVIENNGGALAQGFDVKIQLRKEEEFNFRSDNYCQLSSLAARCTNLTLSQGATATVFGTLGTTDLDAGRYIIRATIVPQTVVQSSVQDDFLETILLIGVTSPEIHPTSITFSPPSPAPQGSQVTVRVEIENTGKPLNPQLQVKFEYCLENPTCADSDLRSNGFLEGSSGVKTVSTLETTPLTLAQPIVVTNVLDTSGFAPGRYLFKVTVTAVGTSELDPNNNDISTRFSIGSSAALNAKCQISGEITTLGEGTGTLQLEDDGSNEVDMLYVASKDTDGDIKVHAIRKDLLGDATAAAPCPEIDNSPIAISGGSSGNISITTFTVDQPSKLLYVGLSSGALWVFDVNQANRLTSVNKSLTGKGLLSFSSRQASATSGQVFVGTEDQLLKRVTVTRNGTGIAISADTTCVTLTAPVNNVQIFQGRTYFTTGTSLQRIDESRCDSTSRVTVFTAGAAINSMAIGNVVFPSFSSTRIVLGLANGSVHILSSSGNNVTNSPVAIGSEITAVAINDGPEAVANLRETVFVGTVDGKIDAIPLRTATRCATTFQTATKQRINVLGVYEPTRGSSVTGWVFAGSNDQRLYTVNDSCAEVQPALTTQGAITANMLVSEQQGFFGPTDVVVIYGGGSGLYETVVPLP